jgi:hypothetical protein
MRSGTLHGLLKALFGSYPRRVFSVGSKLLGPFHAWGFLALTSGNPF